MKDGISRHRKRDNGQVENYFKDLLNEENEHNLEEMHKVEGPIDEISEEEVKRGIKARQA